MGVALGLRRDLVVEGLSLKREANAPGRRDPMDAERLKALSDFASSADEIVRATSGEHLRRERAVEFKKVT